jgi:hypothetical protein
VDLVPRNAPESIPAVLAALEEDRGYHGEGIDFSQGLPEVWPNDRGNYGEHGPFHVMVYVDGTPGEIRSSCSAPAAFRRSEALAALASRIAAKDRPGNDLLLITCRLPDQWGYICSPDEFMFRMLADAIRQGHAVPGPAPQHLEAVVMHSWDRAEWVEVYRAPGSSQPWNS